MKVCIIMCICVSVVLVIVNAGKTAVRLNKHSLCRAKATCEHCLQQRQCAWCDDDDEARPRCFPALFRNQIQCKNITIYEDRGLSVVETAACTCSRGNLTSNCMAPGDDADVCNGRGACICGRCLCNKDMEDPNKMVTGKYCECDNFSCVGVVGEDCTEGPYCRDVYK